jgi:hypothetical protein
MLMNIVADTLKILIARERGQPKLEDLHIPDLVDIGV